MNILKKFKSLRLKNKNSSSTFGINDSIIIEVNNSNNTSDLKTEPQLNNSPTFSSFHSIIPISFAPQSPVTTVFYEPPPNYDEVVNEIHNQ